MKIIKNVIFLAICVTNLLFLNGCSDLTKSKSKMPPETIFEMSIGGCNFNAELAITESEKSKGLMFRDTLPENNGMIFIYDTPQRVSYWMKNTKIPLDIGFVDKNGILTEVKKMYPLSLDAVPSSRDDIQYCIEMNADWFSKNGVFPPAKLDMQKLQKAIDSRK